MLPGFWLTGEIPLREETEPGESGLMLGTTRNHAAPDRFTDEHALAVRTERGPAVLVGCSHRGLLNSVLAALRVLEACVAHIVFGGAHLRSADERHVAWATRRAQELTEHIALGHCTGQSAEQAFATAFGDRYRRLSTGWSWTEGR